MVEKIGEIEEPLHKYKQEVLIVPVEDLEVIEIQRKPSPYHIRRLAESIRKIGFVVPLVVIKKDEKYIIIDGQHRFLAAKEMGLDKLMCIVVPEKYATELMELNIEKVMSLREKCYVALNVYRQFLKENPELTEDSIEIQEAIEYPYYITLGLAYEENQKFFGSAYESIMKKIDIFLPKSLNEALEHRKEKSREILGIDNLTREVVEKVKELGISHPFLYKEIVSFCNPIGRKRKVEESLEEVLKKLKENLEELKNNPQKIREHKFSDTF